jgi:hypothetical protein
MTSTPVKFGDVFIYSFPLSTSPDSGQSPTTDHRLAPIRAGSPIFNRTITLKDTWAKEAKKA